METSEQRPEFMMWRSLEQPETVTRQQSGTSTRGGSGQERPKPRASNIEGKTRKEWGTLEKLVNIKLDI